jgi:5-methylcytosine-specific restriction endonuclease McrA
MGRKRLGTSIICSVCNTEFYRSPSIVAATPHLTCSRKCAAVYRLRGEARNCKQCGKGFYAMKRDIDKGFGLYCSNDCNGAAYRKQVTVNCAWCNSAIERVLNEVESRGSLYCNQDCRTAWQRRFKPRQSRKFSPWHKRHWKEAACRRCGATENLELDHIIPRFAGGPPTKENAQTLCITCNRKKLHEDLKLYPVDKQLMQQIGR